MPYSPIIVYYKRTSSDWGSTTALMVYKNSVPESGGISERNRKLLTLLHQRLSGPFTASDAASLLSLGLPETRKFLAYLAVRGWLSRIRRGQYLTVPLEATEPSQWREDPWIIAAKNFAPSYIGGWSACEHWELTEQIFRDIVVYTTRRVRYRKQDIQGTPFRIIVVPANKLFGTKAIWRGKIRVQVSDPSRTVIDILDTPELGGGIRHVTEVITSYFESEHRNDTLLIDYANKIGNRAVFKRLGYLIESCAHQRTRTCQKMP